MKRKHLVIVVLASAPSMLAHAAPTTVDDFYTPDAAVFSVAAPGFLANDISVAGGLVGTSVITAGLQGSVTAFPNGSFTFTPNAGLATNTSFSYTATDNSGGSSTATITFNMTATLPVAVNDSYVVNAATFNISAPGFLANDTGGIGTLQATLIVSGVANGTLTAFPGGNFTYTPSPGLATDTSFTYRIADALGRTSDATVTLVMSSNLPVAVNDSYTVNSTTLSISAPGFLANDTGGIGPLQGVLISSGVSGGTLTAFPGGNFTYTPNPGRATDDSFTYRMADAVGRTSDATVTLDLTSTLPHASDDVYDLPADLPFSVAALGFLANDTGGIGSLQGILIADAVDFGTLTAFPDGHFTYTPQLGFVGIDSFTYRMADDLGRTDDAVVRLRVGGAVEPVPAPEPGTLALLLVGATAAIGSVRRRRTA